jgi:penicillin-binding protein 1B
MVSRVRVKLRRRRPQGRSWRRRWLFRLSAVFFLVVLAGLGLSYLQLLFTFPEKLGGYPARIYSAPLVLTPGSWLSAAELERELLSRGYRSGSGGAMEPGEFRRRGERVEFHLRPFRYGGGRVSGYPVALQFNGRRLKRLELTPGGESLDLALVEPRPLASFHGHLNELREPVAVEELPDDLLLAVVEVEDRRFYSHRGIDPRGIGRALWEDIWAGGLEQGGSTITQQVLKNVMLDPQKRLGRKLREVILAPLLETLLEKDEILEIYLNEIYLGQKGALSIVGVGAAAHFFFGRDAEDLDLGQAALLAGIIKSPGNYNPWRHPQAARARRDQVLDLMVRNGRLDPARAEAARRLGLRLADSTGEVLPEAGAFLDQTRRLLVEELGARVLEKDGLRIHTTLDTRVQAAAGQALRDGLRRLEADPAIARRVGEAGLQGAVVVLNPESGAVLAMVGDRTPGRGRFNRAVDARRPVGSLFKPFVYLAALQAAARGKPGGITSTTILQDEPLELELDGKIWRPANSDDLFRGPVSVRRAMADSINIPAVRVAQGVGIEAVAGLAERCGFPAGLPRVPALALGAAEASPLDVAVAYSVLGAGGRRPKPRFWDAVLTSDGQGIRPNPVHTEAVTSPGAAYVVTDLLGEVVRTGTGKAVSAAGLTGAVAGKTGTTNQRRDAWFAGFVPGLLAVVWVGADDNRPMGLTGSQAALPIWLELVSRLRPDPGPGFTAPDDVTRVRFDPATGGLATRRCPQWAEDWFMAGTEPQDECEAHRKRGFWKRLFGRD